MRYQQGIVGGGYFLARRVYSLIYNDSDVRH